MSYFEHAPAGLMEDVGRVAPYLIFVDQGDRLDAKETQHYVREGTLTTDLWDELYDQAQRNAYDEAAHLIEKYEFDEIHHEGLSEEIYDLWISNYADDELVADFVRNTPDVLIQFTISGAEDDSTVAECVKDWNLADMGYQEGQLDPEDFEPDDTVRLGGLAFVDPVKARELNDKGGSLTLAADGLFVSEPFNGSGTLVGGGTTVTVVPGTVTLDEFAGDGYATELSADDLMGLAPTAFAAS